MQHCNYYNDDCVKFSDSYEGEVDSKGNPKRYKEMNWKL